MHRNMIVVASLVAPLVTLAAQQAPRAFTPNDWYRVTTVATPALSPDGRLVAFSVITVKEAENRRHSEVWVVPTAGGAAQRYTSPGYESSAPRWSPDGRWLLFTSQRPGSKGRTWGLRMDQPGGEAVEIDSFPAGSSPNDNRFVVFAEPVAGDTTPPKPDVFTPMQPMARPPFGSITRPVDPKRFDGRQIVDMRYKGNGIGFIPGPREARVYRPSQLWIQAFDGKPKRMIDTTRYSRRGPAVSPDGKWIAFVADTGLRPDSVVEAAADSMARMPFDAKRDATPPNDLDIFVIPIAGGTPRRITRQSGYETDLQWSPDGKWITFRSALSRTTSERLWRVPAEGGQPENLVGAWQYEPAQYAWLPNGQILVGAAIGGHGAILTLDPGTKQLREVIGGRREIRGISMDRGASKVAFVSTSVNTPTELAVANTDGTGERKLTSFNDALNREVAWSDAERFTYKSVGGLEIEGWLMKPYGYQPGKKYPLVLYIHGGPHSQYGEGWFDEFQNIAGAGMWVLFTNPRGSSGYGADFTYSTRGRWGMEDLQDLMKAVDIVSTRADVDSTHMGVTGGSYGGFMTAWIEGHTNRFKAAETDRMIAQWPSWYGSSDAQGLTEFEFYGKPWENWKLYDQLSPMRFVDKVQTPTLLVQSEEDFRTPMTEAEEWFMALKKRGIPAEFVRYPRSTHDLSRTGEPWLLVDRLGRLRQWFSYWLKATPPVSTSDKQ